MSQSCFSDALALFFNGISLTLKKKKNQLALTVISQLERGKKRNEYKTNKTILTLANHDDAIGLFDSPVAFDE